jgi:acylphosphatase
MTLGLHGRAKNLPDGRVDVLACGSVRALAEFRAWLDSGPPQAEVRGISCDQLDFRSGSGFSVE